MGGCLVILQRRAKTEDMIPIFNTNGTNGSLIDISLFFSPFIVLQQPWNEVFIAIIVSGTIMMTFSGIVLPSLGGDQVISECTAALHCLQLSALQSDCKTIFCDPKGFRLNCHEVTFKDYTPT